MPRHKTPFKPQSEYEKVKAKYGLTYKQYVFANNYIKSGNGLQSARLAGYRGNQNTLGTMANENLHKPAIIKYIDDMRLYLNNKPHTIDTVSSNTDSNNANGINDGNDIKHTITISEIDNNTSNDTTNGINAIIQRYWDLVNYSPQDAVKRAALADLCKIYGGFAPQKMEIETNQSISMELENARKRLAKSSTNESINS